MRILKNLRRITVLGFLALYVNACPNIEPNDSSKSNVADILNLLNDFKSSIDDIDKFYDLNRLPVIDNIDKDNTVTILTATDVVSTIEDIKDETNFEEIYKKSVANLKLFLSRPSSSSFTFIKSEDKANLEDPKIELLKEFKAKENRHRKNILDIINKLESIK